MFCFLSSHGSIENGVSVEFFMLLWATGNFVLLLGTIPQIEGELLELPIGLEIFSNSDLAIDWDSPVQEFCMVSLFFTATPIWETVCTILVLFEFNVLFMLSDLQEKERNNYANN